MQALISQALSFKRCGEICKFATFALVFLWHGSTLPDRFHKWSWSMGDNIPAFDDLIYLLNIQLLIIQTFNSLN